MEKIRTFIAIEIPEGVKAQLDSIISSLQSKSTASVKWVETGNIHLTLKFLGDIDVSLVGPVTEVLKEASKAVTPFMLEMNKLGVFPNPKRPRVAWAGLDGDIKQLNRLQQSIESDLESLGFERENRKFSPHLTIARVRDKASTVDQERFGNLITASVIEKKAFTVDSVNLMKSQLTRQGPIYTQLASIIIG
ncbi:MAG: RNA 2',3'-cyclic phosphodiesterase [Dehalococcoidales bacterium]|nr:RNA 2',3'-cyclic phosphodiesterase [Dehalococcoidales bacterium]